MKTHHLHLKTTSRKITFRFRWIALLSAAALFAMLRPGTVRADGGEVCQACRETTQLTFESEIARASADFLLAKAKARTLPTGAERQAARDAAQDVLDESQQELRARKRARLAICKMLDECRYNPVIVAANFMSPEEIAAHPNPYFPLIPGTLTRFQHVTPTGTQIIEVRVTRATRVILGVTCIEVRDTVTQTGQPVEDTRDWYAQDRDGNTWYFGELSAKYENGDILSLGGSWEAGVNGAKPGLVMQASPKVGAAYRQEYLVGEAEDCARTESLNESVTVPYGAFANCRKVAEFVAFEPDTVTAPPNKFYAPGIGFVLEVDPNGEREELIAIEHF